VLVALIHWRIKPDAENVRAFLEFWRTKATVENPAGLVGEFLSEPGSLKDFPYITWHLDPESLGDHKPFVNVAFWADEQAFRSQIAPKFNDDLPMLPFEKYRRRRVVLQPDSWRIGAARLPMSSSEGVV
jgi:hypothetical protein